tara:strand:- start:192 stop:455 length:264 start_codon:yes stop_codon:yes gene_type:complete
LGAKRANQRSLWVSVARCRATSAVFAACRKRSQANQKSNFIFPMNSSFQLLAAVLAAASFGVAVAQTAMLEPVPQHSGTQRYVRVVR